MDIWEQYKESGDIRTRNEILVKYIPAVKKVAKHMSSGLPAFISEEDLVSYGTFGLIDAIEKFDPERGYKFETYAVTRIKGAILDELRALDWAPRSVRARTNAIDRVMSGSESGKPMSQAEAAAWLGISPEEFHKFKSDETSSHIGSFDQTEDPTRESGESLSFADVLADKSVDVATMIEYDQIKKNVVKCINKLPERERMLVYLYYYEQMTLANIGKLMKVTESRVCQIHTSICHSLREALDI